MVKECDTTVEDIEFDLSLDDETEVIVKEEKESSSEDTKTQNKEVKKDVKKPVEKKPVEKKYDGPRKVVVYGQEIYTENDPSVTLEDVRVKLVEEYKFAELSKDRTSMTFDQNTGIITPAITFQKKG